MCSRDWEKTKAKAPPHQRVKGEGKERGCTCCSDAVSEKSPLSFSAVFSR